MKKFEVLLSKSSHSMKTFIVEANNKSEAKKKAIKKAAKSEFPEHAVNYGIEHICEFKKFKTRENDKNRAFKSDPSHEEFWLTH